MRTGGTSGGLVDGCGTAPRTQAESTRSSQLQTYPGSRGNAGAGVPSPASSGVVRNVTRRLLSASAYIDAGSAISFSSPAVSKNTVVVGTDAGTLLGLRADNGRERWRFAAKAEIRSSPIVVDDVIYIGSYDENLYAVDLKTGKALWSTDRGAIVGSPVYADGTIYVSLNSGELLALRRES